MTVAHCLADLRQTVKRRRWRGVEVMTGPTGWTSLSNPAFVLIGIAQGPEVRPCDVAERVLIARRAVQRNIGDLEEAVYLSRVRVGRRDRSGRRCNHVSAGSWPGSGSVRLHRRVLVVVHPPFVADTRHRMFGSLTEGLIRLILEEVSLVGNLAEDVVKAGDHQDSDQGAHEHPADRGGTDGAVADRPGAGGDDQREEAGDEGEGGHQDRPEPQFPALDGRLLDAQALPAPLHREFHDEDRILAEQADQHDQADLGVDVVGQAHDLQQPEGAEDPDRQREDHSQRQQEALVLPDQHQIDEDDDDQEDVNGQVPLPRLVVREALPADAVAGRQRLGGDLADRVDGLPAGVAGRRRPLNGGGGVQVIAVDLVQALLLLDAHERGVGDHLPVLVLDEHILQVFGVPPELGRGLDEDLVELAEEDEALLPGAADDDGQVVHRILDRHALLHGHVVVDDQLILRVVAGEEGEQALYLPAFRQAGHELVGHFPEPLVVVRVRLVQDADGEAPGRAEARDRGRLEEFQLHVGHLPAFFIELRDNLARGQLAFGPGLQVDEAGPRVRAAALGQDLIAGQRRDRADAIDALGDLLQLVRLGVGVLDRRTRRRLDDPVDHALVFERDEAGRELRVHEVNSGAEAHDDEHGQRAARDDPSQDGGITPRDLLDAAVEEVQQEGQRPTLSHARVGLEDHRAEDRRERQGNDTGEDNGRGHRDAELAVEGADRPGHEGHRDEDGRHHQGDGDDRAADLVDDLHRRPIGREVLLVHLGVHRLDHHDGVVHHDPDRQHQREERDQVDRQAEQQHEEEGADQGHRDRQGRDQRRTPVTEEEEDHQGHQHERLEQGVEHLVDGGLQEGGDVVADLIVHTGRERLRLDLLQLLLDLLDDGGGVGAGGLLQDDGGGGVAVDVRVDVVVRGAQFDVGDVLEPQDLAIRICLENNISILIRLVVAPHVGQNVLDRLRRLARRLAEASGRADHALLSEGLHDVVGRQVVGAHAVELQPDPHGVLAAAEDRGAADAPDPLDLGQEVDVGVVVEEVLVDALGRAVDVHVHQHARHGLHDDDPLPLHQGGKPVLHDGDPVVHVQDRHVRVGARLEDDLDRRFAGAGGGGGHVAHVLDAVDGLLQRDQDRVDQDRGTGAGIGDRDHHARRRDGGELGDRQRLDRQRPQEQDDHRDHDRQRRPIEDFCEHGSRVIGSGSAPGTGRVP